MQLVDYVEQDLFDIAWLIYTVETHGFEKRHKNLELALKQMCKKVENEDFSDLGSIVDEVSEHFFEYENDGFPSVRSHIRVLNTDSYTCAIIRSYASEKYYSDLFSKGGDSVSLKGLGRKQDLFTLYVKLFKLLFKLGKHDFIHHMAGKIAEELAYREENHLCNVFSWFVEDKPNIEKEVYQTLDLEYEMYRFRINDLFTYYEDYTAEDFIEHLNDHSKFSY